VEKATCRLPSRAETDMSYSNTAVDEEDRKTRQREKPIKDHSALRRQVNICQAAEEKLENDHRQGTSLFVDIG
jgi:hypothetical protein